MSVLEAGMMLCFGASWPFQVAKTYKTKEVKGKSILFLWLVEIGYILGMLHHVLYAPDSVVFLYLLNFLLVGTDMTLYYRYKNRTVPAFATVKIENNELQKEEIQV